MLESNTIFSSSEVSQSQTLRYCTIVCFSDHVHTFAVMYLLIIEISCDLGYCEQNLTKRYFFFFLDESLCGDGCKLFTPLSPQSGFGVTYFYHHFYLKATKCQKGTTDSTACQFRNDRVSFV